MLGLLPTRSQWRTWTKPTKYEFAGLIIALLALFSIPDRIGKLFAAIPIQTYSSDRKAYVSKLSDASTCLAARLYYDGLHILETDCKIDLKGLAEFSRRFAPYMAVTPYSGAWNLENYSRRVEEDSDVINASRGRAGLRSLEKGGSLSLAETAYYLCGIEWYLRSAPPDTIGEMSKERVKTYQAGWLSWQHETGSRIRYAPFEHSEFEVKDDPDCSSFIDLLD